MILFLKSRRAFKLWRTLIQSLTLVWLGVGARLLGAEPVVLQSIDLKLVKIPAGEFLMGAEVDPQVTFSHFPNINPAPLQWELPRRKVRIVNDFFIGQCEVTLKQFSAFYDDAKYKLEIERDGESSYGYAPNTYFTTASTEYRPWAPGAWKPEGDHPAIYVTWNDAVAFCDWLTKREGLKFRLPTEAEWEYACRAGTASYFSFGDDASKLALYGNVADADRKALFPKAMVLALDERGKETRQRIPFPFLAEHDGYAWTSPVGKYKPNAFGVYDMHGNVWEWCLDHDSINYNTDLPMDDPISNVGPRRVIRGGAFNTPAQLARCAKREFMNPSDRRPSVGFRVVCERTR